MITKNKLPGDILKIMKKVDQQPMNVKIHGLSIKMSRKQFDELMKCTLFTFPSSVEPDGFYLVDKKARKATFKWSVPSLKSSDVTIDVEGRVFKVNQPWKGYLYA